MFSHNTGAEALYSRGSHVGYVISIQSTTFLQLISLLLASMAGNTIIFRPVDGRPEPEASDVSGVIGVSASAAGSANNAAVRYMILEELPAGTPIGNLVDDAGLRQRYGPEVVEQLRFRFVSAADAASLPFEIGAVNGALRTTGPIDRDTGTICNKQPSVQQQQHSSGSGSYTSASAEGEDRCEVHLSIVVQPVQYLQIIRVIIDVVDVNDNAPRFRETTVQVQINEAAAVGITYVLPTAVDADGRKYGIRRYELETSAAASGKFGLTTSRKLDGSTDVRLVLAGRLDRETEAQYRLRLVAIDGGEPARSGSVDLIVTVMDSNDNRPEFTSAEYQATVAENAPVGTVVVQVHAVDRDSGANGNVEYSFAAQTQSQHGHLFGVRNASGAIYVRGPLDHESSSIYHLIVIGRDQGPDSVASEATVVVHVEDVNDNAPTIVASTLNQAIGTGGLPGSVVISPTGATIASVSEDAPMGTFVAHLSVTDPDAGLNGRVNCTLTSSGSGGLSSWAPSSTLQGPSREFTLTKKYLAEYQVVTSTTLDRERIAQYALTVRCRDAGMEPLTSTLNLIVNVLDVNDNPPTFSSQTYRGTLMENNIVGVSVLQVTATDWDEGNNGRIQYSIPGNLSVSFHVDQRGVISAQDKVDREKWESFSFPVLAVDHGRPALTGSALVRITVGDVDDEKPIFIHQTTPISGSGISSPPGLHPGGAGGYLFNVTENEPPGVRVGTVTAEDKDGMAENSAFVYLFDTGLPNTDEFAIDPHSGLIVTRKILDRELNSVYRLKVMARPEKGRSNLASIGAAPGAAGGGRYTAVQPVEMMSGTTADVIVVVVDQNDNPPTVLFPTSSNRTVHLSTRAPVGYTVARIIARDPDFDVNAILTYELVAISLTDHLWSNAEGEIASTHEEDESLAELFVINRDNGEVYVGRSIADRDQQSFDVTFSVTDNGHPPRKSKLSDVVPLRIVVDHAAPLVISEAGGSYPGAGFESDYGELDDSEWHLNGLLGLMTRRAGLVAYISAAVGIGCCLAIAAPIAASVVVRRRRRKRKRKETDGRLQESLRSMLAPPDSSGNGNGVFGASSTATCDVMKSTGNGPIGSTEVKSTSSPYQQRNGAVKSSMYSSNTAHEMPSVHDVNDGGSRYNDLNAESPPWSLRLTSSPSAVVGCISASGVEPHSATAVPPERDESIHSAEGSSVTDSGRGPSEEGAAATNGTSLPRCIPPPPPPAIRATYPMLPTGHCWTSSPSSIVNHHQQVRESALSTGGCSTTLPSRHRSSNHHPPVLKSALSSVSFNGGRKKTTSSSNSASSSPSTISTVVGSDANTCLGRRSQKRGNSSAPPPPTRTTLVRFSGIGTTLVEEDPSEDLEMATTSGVVISKSNTSGNTEFSSPPASSSAWCSTLPASGSRGGGSSSGRFHSCRVASTTDNGSCRQRDAVDTNGTDSASTLRTGRALSGTGATVSCLRSATVQPLHGGTMTTTSRSFDV